MKTVGLLTLSLAGALFIAGCPSNCPTQQITDPARALAMHARSRETVRVIRAEARVEQWGREGRVKGTVLMFVERPDRVRFDAMTQMGPASILTSDGNAFALTDLRENRYLTGPTCPQNIARLLGIPMSGEQVALFLLGSTPRIDATQETMECTGDGTYLVTLTGGAQRQEIELSVDEADVEAPPDRQRLRLVRSELFDANGTVWRATFDDWQTVGDGVAMPFEVRFEHPREEADTTVKFEDVDLNVEVPANAFQQEPRPGLPVEQVPCD